ncbi:hypothetical protein JCM33774_76630 [Actinophytocola sp. KF-1]
MGEDLGFPGNRELLERQLAKATTQVLFLAQDTPAGSHSLAERAAEMIRGVEIMPAEERFWNAEPSPAVVATAAKDGIPPDIAEAYVQAKTEVKAILAEAFPS